MADVRLSNDATLDPPAKILKLDEPDKTEKTVHANIKDLSTFCVKRILNNNTRNKLVCLEGSFESLSGVGLVILEKTAFEEDSLKNEGDYFAAANSLKKVFHNDIYGNYEYFPKIELNSIKTTIIHPATEKHINKYTIQNPYIVDETPQIYEDVVLPYIKEEQFDLQWVYNILEHKSEVDRIVYEDLDPINGFVLLPDLKWNGTTIETLYLLAIIRLRDIKSLRDLQQKHLPLLKNIKTKATKTIEEKYGLNESQLRIYLHYQPSFYHLHVHFTYLRYEAPGILTERSHLLTNVISNIELLPDYYQKVTLPFVVRDTETLFTKLESKDLYDNFVLEIRPRLRSANVFIKLKKSLKKPQISFDENAIGVIDGDEFYTLPSKNIKPLPESLTCVQIRNKSLSFRFLIDGNENSGTFNMEILSLEIHPDVKVETFLTKYVTYNINCANCSQVFCKDVDFERILPLPSENSEPGDWFCHGHGGDANGNLDPKLNDVFYSACSAHLNGNLFDGILKTTTNVTCKRCLCWIGLVLNGSTLKVWYNTVCFDERNISHKSNALNDVYISLRGILAESFANTRIVLQCRVLKNQTDYVLLWVMEKKLNVLMDTVDDGLRDLFVAKVLFRFESGSCDVVEEWMNDIVISSVDVSKPMMVELLKQLYAMNELFPRDCCKSNDFYISYLSMYD